MHNEHIGRQLRDLHDSVLTIVSLINRPDRDEVLIREAGIQLDRALFPLLVLIDRYGPLGIVDLAGRVGRDHSVVSRQVAKLVALGLVAHESDAADRRLRKAAATSEGAAFARRIDAARERLGRKALASWSGHDVEHLVVLMARFAKALDASVES